MGNIGDSQPLRSLESLIERSESLLTDSKHPLDERHAREISLMLQQQTSIVIGEIYNTQLTLARDMYDFKNNFESEMSGLLKNLQERRAFLDSWVTALDVRLSGVETTVQVLPQLVEDVKGLKETRDSFPSLLWLLHKRTTLTVRWVVGVIAVVFFLLMLFRQPLLAWLGLPDFEVP